MNSFKSIKYQTEIYYYHNDIEYCEAGEWACSGVGNDGFEYDITFTNKNEVFCIKDVNRK
ncbi:MAG: hypothetical protein QXF82_02925 [Nitrososphaeria archaeon]